MVVIRPITMNDLGQLEAIARLTGYGLTTLPRDTKLLRRRIRESERGFEALVDEHPPKGEGYLFVMEDLETTQIVGTCGIASKVGGFEPFYTYRIEISVHESKDLGVRKEIPVLHLHEEHDGPSEICTLFLKPEYRKDGNGRLLSQSRFLFMAEHKDYFDPTVIAEMRGVVDDTGHSAFWEAIGRHFFNIDFPDADYLSVVSKRFIADLMPRHPIYIPLLPKEAQDVIGQVHEHTRPALKILEAEGFRTCELVDIFEGGPVVKCPLNEIRTVRESVREVVAEVTEQPIQSDRFLIANTLHDYRACKGNLAVTPDGVRLTAEVAAALGVKAGDPVRYALIHPTARAVTKSAITLAEVHDGSDGSEVALY
jgi:arginine N-succinyltransferase